MSRPTIRDIARASGVSTATVVRTLTKRGYASASARARVEKAAAELNYVPNLIARSLSSGQSKLVGFVARPWVFADLRLAIDSMEQSLREAGYSVLYRSSGTRAEAERASLRQLMENRVAGVVVLPNSEEHTAETYSELISTGAKLVVINRFIEGLNAPQFIADDYRAGRIATDYLISLGHRDIAYLAMPESAHMGRERARGFRDALSSAGIAIAPSWVVETAQDDGDGFQVMARILQSEDPPTAVLVHHDVAAVGAMRAVFEAGLSIPEDISLASYGDIWPSDMLRVALTTVRHPVAEMVRLATETLLSMLDGNPVAAETTVLDVELVIRSSCGRPRHR